MIKDNDGVITLFSGDTGDIILGGFNPEHNYMVYLQFSDEDGKFIGEQMALETNYSDSVSFHLPAAISDKLTVPLGEDYQLYYLGGKRSEIVKTYIDLYAWDNSGLLYTHVLSPVVGEKTYNAENEETEYTVSSIESIVYENETYEKDASSNINEYATSLYAWKDSENNIVYTSIANPTASSVIYNSEGESTGNTVAEHYTLYKWNKDYRGSGTAGAPHSVYTKELTPEQYSYIFDENGNKVPAVYSEFMQYASVDWYDSENGNIHCAYGGGYFQDYIIDEEGIEKEGIASSNNVAYIRSQNDDIQTIVRVIAYAWSKDETSIYTMGENPLTGDILYNSELEDIGTVDAINSVIINSNEYERSADDDISALISTDYITEDTIIPELGGKKPVIVYRKVAEGPV